jgi:hypothetical protein
MLTGNMHAQRFGMPDYIRRLRAQGQPVVQSEPLPEMGAPPMAAPPPPPRQTNAAPIGIMPQGAQHMGGKPKFDMGLFNQSFEKPKMTLADKLGIASGYLMDLDGSFGAGNADKFKGMYDERVGEARSEFDTKRQAALMMAAAQGDMNAMFMLDPSLALGEKRDARNFGYQQGRDAKADDQFERMWLRDEGRYETEQERLTRLDDRAVFESDRSHNLAVKQANTAGSAGRFGVTPVFGRDKDGNRVILQTNTAGGVDMAALPEGVTLEDDYSRTMDRETAKNDAKKAAYESTAGQALTAFEAKTDELLGQIDTAIDQTKGGIFGNTGFIGQFIAAGDLDGTLDAIGAKAMLSELIAIKNQGGALGALSDSEGKALRDAAVNVARSQSEKQLDANLKAYRLQVETSRMRLKQAFEEQYMNGGGAAQGQPTTPANRPVGPSGQPVPEGFE